MNASENEFSSEESEEENDDDDDDDNDFDKPLDPRAGSVHVELSQIPVDISALINLFKKHELKKQTTPKSRKKIRALIQK